MQIVFVVSNSIDFVFYVITMEYLSMPVKVFKNAKCWYSKCFTKFIVGQTFWFKYYKKKLWTCAVNR